MSPRPYCAAAPEILRSVRIATRVPPFAESTRLVTSAEAVPFPRVSVPFARSTTRRCSSATSSRTSVPEKERLTGPILTSTFPFQV